MLSPTGLFDSRGEEKKERGTESRTFFLHARGEGGECGACSPTEPNRRLSLTLASLVLFAEQFRLTHCRRTVANGYEILPPSLPSLFTQFGLFVHLDLSQPVIKLPHLSQTSLPLIGVGLDWKPSCSMICVTPSIGGKYCSWRPRRREQHRHVAAA